MNKQEIEVKILEIDVAAVLAKLEHLGAVKIFDHEISSDFFRNQDDMKLRIRSMDDKNILTYKKRKLSKEVLHNEEIEVIVDDAISLQQIILAAGFVHYGHSEKHRLSYQYQDIRFDIDTMIGIPTFLEVEGDTIEAVRMGVTILGYTMDQTCTLTERKLKEHYNLV